VADSDSGLQIIEFFGTGIQESFKPQATSSRLEPTVVHGVLYLKESRSSSPSCLMDISGRKVMSLHPGANDVRTLAPGIYFVRSEPSAASRGPSAVTKVVLER
jgi:hypothetical protein